MNLSFFKIFFLLTIFHTGTTHAQQVYFKHYTVDDGLPSNEIYQVIQDGSGNLLAATDRGAVRYDGYSFESIPSENGQLSNPVYYIYKSPTDKIYFSGLKGYIYEYKFGELSGYPYNQKITSLFRHSGILIANTLAAQGDSLWISYNNDFNYLFKIGSCLVLPGGEVKKLHKPDGIYFDLSANFFFRQLSDTNQQNHQPVFITWKDGSLTKDSVDLFWRSGYIRRLYYEQAAGYDLFCVGRKLLVYKNKEKIGSFLFPHDVLSLTVLNGNQLYLGFEYAGAAIYEINKGIISGPVDTYLKDLTVTSIYKDNEEGIWFSTQESGLYYSYPAKITYWENESKIECIEKNKNRVFIGYRSGLIQVFDKGKLLEQLTLPIQADNFLNHFSFDLNDSLIAITSKGYFLKKQNGWNYYPGTDTRLLPVNSDTVYGAASANAELNIYKEVGGKLVKKVQLSKRIISMLYDSKKQLWLGTWEGLFKFDNTPVSNQIDHDIFKDRIIGIKQMPDNWLAIATLGSGLALYKDKKIFVLDVKNGLRTSIINSLTVDNNDIWLGTNKGLSKVNFKDEKFAVRNFGIESGLPSMDIHEFTIADGHLYLKWINRLVTIPLDKLLKPDIYTSVKITSVVLNDIKINDWKNNVFKYNQNTLSFNFSSINLSSASEQEYTYILEGFGDKWNRTKERNVKYTNLSPGNYRFKVQAYRGEGGLLTDIATYEFTIIPAYWQYWWFPFIIVSALLLVSFLVFQRRLTSIKKKNQLLLDLAESQQQALIQLINPHFLFNILNTVQGAILKLDKITAASIVARFAKLMRLSMELSKKKFIILEKELELIKRYFDLESVRSTEKFVYHIEMGSSVDPSLIYIPSMLMQPFIENAIRHGVIHLSGKQGIINIKFMLKNNELICSIDDNGIGRQESEAINKNTRTDHQSSGIEITVSRLRLLHKERQTNFLYEVKDKKNSSGDSEGTTIIFSIPFKTIYEQDTGCNY